MAIAATLAALAALPLVALFSAGLFLLGLGGLIRHMEESEAEDEES